MNARLRYFVPAASSWQRYESPLETSGDPLEAGRLEAARIAGTTVAIAFAVVLPDGREVGIDELRPVFFRPIINGER